MCPDITSPLSVLPPNVASVITHLQQLRIRTSTRVGSIRATPKSGRCPDVADISLSPPPLLSFPLNTCSALLCTLHSIIVLCHTALHTFTGRIVDNHCTFVLLHTFHSFNCAQCDHTFSTVAHLKKHKSCERGKINPSVTENAPAGPKSYPPLS